MRFKMHVISKRIFFILALALISGCGVWQNFTVYFNRYYNASNLFEDAEEQMALQPQELFEFKEIKLPGAINQSLTQVIEKCSKILQFDKESSYFDNCLFMIGKSFYYQQEYSKALRKFNELAAVPESDFHMENQYWIGLTELQLRNFDKGFAVLDEVKAAAKEDNDDELLHKTYIKQIAFLIYRENYLSAVNLSNELLEVSGDDELNAELSYQLGKLYVKLNQLENAAKAFADVDNYSPTFEVEFSSKLENAKLQKQLGNTDLSLELLEDLRDEGKYELHFDEIDLEIAQIYLDKGDFNTALDIYTDVDTTFKKSPSSGLASFKIAEIWEKQLFDYDSAKYFYENTISSQAPADVKKLAQKKSQVFKQYKKIEGNINRYEKQIFYKDDPEAFNKDSLDYAFYLSQDTLNKRNENTLPGDLRDNPNKQQENQKYLTKPFKMAISKDSLNTLISKNMFDMGNLFFTELEVPDSAFYYYSTLLNDYPGITFKPKLLYTLGSYYATIDNNKAADSLFTIVYENYSADPVAIEAAKKLGKTERTKVTNPAEIAYLSAEEKFLDSNYEEAIDSFYNIYINYPGSPLAPKALYAVGWILENEMGSLDSAAVIYDTLTTKYANTDYSRSVYTKINFYRNEEKRIQDSLFQIQKQIADSIAADSAAQFGTAIGDSLSADTLNVGTSALADSLTQKSKIPPDTVKKSLQPFSPEELEKMDEFNKNKKPDIKKKGKGNTKKSGS